ncbi:MAG: YbaK/EbsC family protein [Solobacterium sp.]|nr:YbaK/EbsC family protein [Solobacterium sp.]MBQ6533349.1 YbaK/EbsC family protein [Solobacterium sp.]MBR0214606.1 YbaK/EbsC family protein [Solobacterium sp.]
MSLESVKAYFRRFGMEDRIILLDESSATVELAAHALGCEGKEIAKTMSFLVDEKPVIIVMAGDARIQNHKYKARFHTKARMLHGEEVEALTGHPIGGVCPFGLKEGCTVYLDNSLKRFEHVYPACGSGNSAIRMTIPDMEKYSGYTEWIDVTTNPDEEA